MDQEDVDLTVRLARWMGWRENHPGADVGGVDVFDTFSPPDPVVVTRYSQRAQRREAWHPLTRPDPAAEIMAEAVRRGGRVETVIQCGRPPFTIAHVYLKGSGPDLVHGEGVSEDAEPARSWCRAVCLAVLAAEEGLSR